MFSGREGTSPPGSPRGQNYTDASFYRPTHNGGELFNFLVTTVNDIEGSRVSDAVEVS